MITPYVNIHTHRRTGEGIEVVSVMAGRDAVPDPPFSIGIHPWQLGGGNGRGDFISKQLEEAFCEIMTAPAAAIGEIGLDHAIPADHAEQKTIFFAQLRVAQERGLPIILHCVRAFEPTCEILAANNFANPVIFHGFIGSPEQAARAAKAGYYLSFGVRSLDSPKTVEAMKHTPLDRLFLETDDTPIPIAEIYARAVEIIAVPMEEFTQSIHANYTRLFSKQK